MRTYTGLIDMVVNGSPSTIKFAAQIRGNKATHAYPAIDRRGRGTNGPKIRLGDFSGSGSGSGELQWQAYPFPSAPKYATGTITRVLKMDVNGTVTHSVTIPVRITALEFEYVEKNDTGWRISFSWVADGNPTIVWAGSQVPISVPDPNDQETYAGLSKTYDANGLASGATQRIDFEGISDDDSAEVTKLIALVAAAIAPMSNLKVLSAQWQRSDTAGGSVLLTWALQDSKDQQETPRNTFFVDPQGIKDSRTFATVWATGGSAPAWPAAPEGLKQVDYTDQKLNDQYSVRVWHWGRVDSADEILNPEAKTSLDPNGLASTSSTGVLFDPAGDEPSAPTDPNGLKLRSTNDVKINDTKTNRVYEFGENDTKDDAEFEQERTSTDANVITSEQFEAQVYSTGSPPADPSTPAGLKLIDIIDRPLTAASGKSLRVWRFGTGDSKDRVEWQGTLSNTDATVLENEAQITQVTSSSSPPETPSSPVAEAKFIDVETKQIALNRWAHTFKYSTNTSQDKIERDGTELTTDGNGLRDSARITQVTNSSTPPSTPSAPVGKYVQTVSQQLTDTYWKHTFLYADNDSADSEVFPRTRTVVDPNDLRSETFLASVFTTGTPPSDPSTPSGQKLVETSDIPLTPLKSVRVWHYGKKDSKDEYELPATFTVADPNSLESKASVGLVDASPSLPAGFVERSTRSENVTPDHTLNIIEGGLRTTQEDIEFPGTFTNVDPQGLDTEGRQTTVHDTASPPSDPTPPTGTKIVGKTVLNLTSAGTAKSQTVWQFGVMSSADKLIYPRTTINEDPSGIGTTASAAGLDGVYKVTVTNAGSGYTSVPTVAFSGGGGTGASAKATVDLTSGTVTGIYVTNPGSGYGSAPTVAITGGGGSGATATAIVASGSMPSLPSELVAYDTEAVQVGGRILITHKLGEQSKAGEIASNATSAMRSALTAWRDVVAFVVNSTSDVRTLADSQWASFQSVANAYGVTVKALTPNRKLVLLEYMNPGVQVIGSTRGGGRWVPARINSGTAQVYIAKKLSIDGSLFRYLHQSKYIVSSPIRQFTVVRLLSGTTVPDQSSLIGKTNNASFLGLAAGSCLYTGAEYTTNIASASTYPFLMYYHFYSDANGIFDYTGIRDDWFISSASVSNGWVSASSFTDNELNVAAPTQADFSPFTS